MHKLVLTLKNYINFLPDVFMSFVGFLE